ncbi:general transcription factor 3C polypeptide 1 [Aplochiton taeniatus]
MLAMDALSVLHEEVALEGLDGITIPTLWIRLENRTPHFPLTLDSYTKDFLWMALNCNDDLNFYELPKERDDITLFDRFAEIDPETGIQETQRFDATQSYPVQVILDNKDGIQGSCPFYKERKLITSNIRSQDLNQLLSLEEAFNRWGRKLVMVASQAVRFRVLIGEESDPELKLSDHSYCILERLGRARWQGELQRDLHACSFKTDAGKMHYMRSSLDRHGLITTQSHVIRLPSGAQQHSLLLLTKRFHVNRRSKYDILMESTSKLLQEMPRQLGSIITLRGELNVNERTFKRVYQYMVAAKLAQLVMEPLDVLNPMAGPCVTKRGTKILVRCVKLIKPYEKKDLVAGADEDENEDEDGAAGDLKCLPYRGQTMERDLISQAYQIVVSRGARGITQSGIRQSMNIGKLEARMVCRLMERSGMVKGFMEDVGRQRTTKYISHRNVGVSDHLQQFAKEQERSDQLRISGAEGRVGKAPKTPAQSSKTASAKTGSATPKTTSSSAPLKKLKIPERKTTLEFQERGSPEENENDGDKIRGNGEDSEEEWDETKKKKKGKGKATVRKAGPQKKTGPKVSLQSVSLKETTGHIPVTHSAPIQKQTPVEEEEEEEDSALPTDVSLDQSECETAGSQGPGDSVTVEEVIPNHKAPRVYTKKKPAFLVERPHETYRVLKRKNLILESVRSLKIVEGLYTLQKMINEEEKLEGVSTKCCKKSVLRIIRSLSKEGLIKMFTTTVMQDGVKKTVEFVAHSSIQSSDPIVKSAIEQVRFRISSSYSNIRVEQEAAAAVKAAETAGAVPKTRAEKKPPAKKEAFKPTIVKGLSRSLGYQPKMHRLRLIHEFLWYIIYGHPLRRSPSSAHSQANSEPPCNPGGGSSPAEPGQPSGTARVASADGTGHADPTEAAAGGEPHSLNPEKPAGHASPPGKPEVASSTEDEDEEEMEHGHFHPNMKVYADDESWKRYIPPAPIHREFGYGWALTSDLLLCLPLSIFVQIIQINFKIDGLDSYLMDPGKQHFLIRFLPSKMKRLLLYKRKYIYSFLESLQRLCYMGLLQFGPFEKFQEKDQVFVYLKMNTMIVDTTCCEPHYWQVKESADKPFERRRYTFTTFEDVHNYWFDLLCVCLNTPLGVIRGKRGDTAEKEETADVCNEKFFGLAKYLKGNREVCDDGTVPGDCKGAGGLDSDFYGHLKRNWIWTSYLLSAKKNTPGENQRKLRLSSLLSKHSLSMALKALFCLEQIATEPASRNQKVAGGKKQKRKRLKKDPVKAPPKKKKEGRKRRQAKDEVDHRALKRMTRHRVTWSLKEDSLMMLCCVATTLMNSKMRRPFVPYCVVRDLLHAEFELSLDKTSLAVGRRSRYIFKNPQTLLNYRICLAEVYQDKALMEVLDKKRPPNPDNEEVCSAVFLEYITLLRQKFSYVMRASDIIVPDTKQQLFSRFKVCCIEDGSERDFKDTLACFSTEDIHTLVLSNLVQSTLAMSNSQMQSCRSFQTFHIYSKYRQDVLCQVFLQCRKKGLVNRRRVSQYDGPKKSRAMPILPMSYQLSQTYFKIFTWRFPVALCTDVFDFVETLKGAGAAEDRAVSTFHNEKEERPGVMRERRGEATEERQKKRKLEEEAARKDGEQQGEEAAGEKRKDDEDEATGEPQKADTEMEDVEVPAEEDPPGDADRDQRKGDEEQSGPGTDVDAQEGTQRTERAMEPSEEGSRGEPSTRDQTEGPLPDERQSGSGTEPGPAPPASEELQDVSDMLLLSLDTLGGTCVACLSLMTLGRLAVHISIPKQIVVVDSTLVDNDVVKSLAALEEEEENDEGEECEGRKRLEVKARQASHTNYLMMRGYCTPGIVNLRNLSTNDSIVVESCTVRLQLRRTPAHQLFATEGGPPLNFSKQKSSDLPPLLTRTLRPLPSFSSLSSLCPPRPSLSASSALEECKERLVRQLGYTPEDLEACAELLKSLDGAAQFGWDVEDLQQAHTHLAVPRHGRTRSLQQYVEDLKEVEQALEVGGLGERVVLMQHAGPWLLTSTSRPRARPRFAQRGQASLGERRHSVPSAHTEKANPEDGGVCNVSFVSRPWRIVDGSLNRPVCKGMLESILYHIMTRPGLTQQALVEHYRDALQPLVVMDLVKALIEMGCVKRKTVANGPKPSLFSRGWTQGGVETGRPETVFYEPTVDCCLRLSQVFPHEPGWNLSNQPLNPPRYSQQDLGPTA